MSYDRDDNDDNDNDDDGGRIPDLIRDPRETTTTIPVTVALAPDGCSPEWTDSSVEIHCPICDYNLFGLSEPRCPECGYRFEWQKLFEAKSNLHPFLYEHHPERRFRAFWRTAWATLRPGRFWRQLQPAHRLERARLARYGLRAAACLVLPLLLSSMLNVRGLGLTRAPMPVSDFWWVAWALAAWVTATIAVLQIFRASMRRAKVLPGHVLRCAVYGSDFVAWIGLVFFVLVVFPPFDDTLMGGAVAGALWSMLGVANWDRWEMLLMCAAVAVFAWRLARAYQLYLRFDHPFATVLSSQVIVLLSFLVVLTWIYTSGPATYRFGRPRWLPFFGW